MIKIFHFQYLAQQDQKEKGEINKKDYIFVSNNDFNEKIKKNYF